MAAGRMLAVCAYRDATDFADRPFDRGEKDAAATVPNLLPKTFDGEDRAFGLDVARAFWDLAEDLTAGRVPLPRCHAETWALQTNWMRLPGSATPRSRSGCPSPRPG